MNRWKSYLVLTFFVLSLIPSASAQAAVAYSISFTNGQVQLDVSPDSGRYYSNIVSHEESRFEFSENLKDNESRIYTNNTDISNNQKILYLTIHVDWSIENWTYNDTFSMNAFGLSRSSSEQSDSMHLTHFVNEDLVVGSIANGEAQNESDFEASFYRNAPSLTMSFNFTAGNPFNFSEVNFEVTTKIVTWNFTNIIAGGGVDCTEMVISNEGQATIDVDVSLSGGGVTVSPGAVSVTLAPGGSITVPICVLSLMASSYKTVQVSALASGRETNTQLNQVNKNAGFAVIVAPYASISFHAVNATADFCLGQDKKLDFIVVNNGNYQDTFAFEVLNESDLLEAGFVVNLPFYQAQVDAAGEQPVRVTVSNNANASVGQIPITVEAVTTLQGQTDRANSTTILNVMDCNDGNVESVVPSISIISAVIILGLIAIFRKR